MRQQAGLGLGGFLVASAFAVGSTSAEEILKPAVVVVTLFEGEYNHWKRHLLHEDIPFEAGASRVPLGWNAEHRLLGLVTGMAGKNTAQSITALGHDSRFDLSESYWMVAGIAGFDPNVASLGSVAVASWLIDGNMVRFVDPREMPKSWSTGWLPFNRTEPYGLPEPSVGERESMAYQLSPNLLHWAIERTKAVDLGVHTEAQRRISALYAAEWPATKEPPSVAIGDTLSTDAFWAGELTTEWAREWTRYWSLNTARFSACAMEDLAVAQALAGLNRVGRTRSPYEGLIVLRAASNFVMPPKGYSPALFDWAFQPDPAFKSVFAIGQTLAFALAAGEAPEARGHFKGDETVTLWA